VRRAWLGLDALVQVRMQEPDVVVSIDTRGGDEMRITAGDAAEDPDLTLALTADSFHEVYTGRLNVFSAFASHKVKAEGNVALIMQTAWTLPLAIRTYREHCALAGVPEPEPEASSAEMTEDMPEALSGDRVDRLRERFLRRRREVCVERARYLTASYQETEGQPAVLRQARALEHILARISVRIEPDELLVGNVTGRSLGAGVYPEGIAGRLLGELPNLTRRDCNTFAIAEEDGRELVESILPYWRQDHRGPRGAVVAARDRQVRTNGAFHPHWIAGIGHAGQPPESAGNRPAAGHRRGGN
jgi:hypothetical protein